MSAVVQTRSGKLEGKKYPDQYVFRGIPYAAPPVGALRWHPPVREESWVGLRQAQKYGASALQSPLDSPVLPSSRPSKISEDCLYLNVWTPDLDGERRPVMVYLHHGAHMVGSGDELMPSQHSLVSTGNIVLVSLNSRLGAMGFLNLAEVTAGAIPASGNEGLLDQMAALEWVRENIAAFGGDPDNVTVFGAMAGALSLGCLLGMPSASGLFHKAILQSGACHSANPPERMLRISERIIILAGTRSPAELMQMSSARWLEVQDQFLGAAVENGGTWETDLDLGDMPLQPCIDGKIIPDLPIEQVRSGLSSQVPVLVGSNSDEYKAFSYAALDGLNEEGLRGLLSHIPNLEDFISAYRKSLIDRGVSSCPIDILSQITADRDCLIPALRLAEAQSQHQDDVYNYLCTWSSPTNEMGSTHGMELHAVFGTWDLNEATRSFFGTGEKAAEFSHTVQQAWTAFATTGNPSCASLGDWPAYRLPERSTMILGAACGVEDAPLDAERCLWNETPDDAMGY